MKKVIVNNTVVLQLSQEEQKDFNEFLNSLDDTTQNIQNLVNFQMKEFYQSSVPNLIKGNR
jgi:hypothetical protein